MHWMPDSDQTACVSPLCPGVRHAMASRSGRLVDHRLFAILPVLAWLVLLVPGLAQNDSTAESFNWTRYRTSPIDLLIDNADVFRHGTADLNSAEQEAWQSLLDEVIRRRQQLRDEDPEHATSRWEMAFYRFADVRRTAWENGALQIRKPEAKKDPFRRAAKEATDASASPALEEYSIITDIQNHPKDFVGKPVVLQGIMQRPNDEVMGQLGRRRQPEGIVLHVGELVSFHGGNGSIAQVHTTGVERTSGENPGISAWPGNRKYLPVLVKGWFVKLRDGQRPLIYCESVRELSVQPPTTLIRRYAVSQRPLLTEESWLYYETISTLEAINGFRSGEGRRFWQEFPVKNPPESPRQTAERFLRSRLYDLLAEIAAKYEVDKADLERKLKSSKISDERYESELKRLRYLVNQRINRHSEAQKDPRQFDTYVDLFMNPDEWQGQLVTLRGHVRHVVSYPATHPDFHHRRLHELWLFTDDSQNNPAVIITPTLPDEFPVDADLIDHVSVTGCVFKQYVYRGQESRRIAPLILADRITWSPSDSHLRSLQKEGHIAKGSRLAQRAQLAGSQGPGGTLVLAACFLATLTIMVLWGRAQRDRRERRNLMNRIAEKPVFETSLDDSYAPRLSEYTSGYEL